VGLLDLDLSRQYVRDKIVEYLNTLIDIGVGGFRVDAAKHMQKDELKLIYDAMHNLNTAAGFAANTKPFMFNEVS